MQDSILVVGDTEDIGPVQKSLQAGGKTDIMTCLPLSWGMVGWSWRRVVWDTPPHTIEWAT